MDWASESIGSCTATAMTLIDTMLTLAKADVDLSAIEVAVIATVVPVGTAEGAV
jgi:hypothetical protein